MSENSRKFKSYVLYVIMALSNLHQSAFFFPLGGGFGGGMGSGMGSMGTGLGTWNIPPAVFSSS